MFSQASPAQTAEARRRDDDRIVGVSGSVQAVATQAAETLEAEAAERPEDNANVIPLIPEVIPVEMLDKVLWWFR
ncbi:MAG: hypothetical protein AB1555_10780 [Nitrospirota bacterium]